MPKSQHLLVKKDKKNSVKTHINLNKNLEAPVKRGDIIGEAIVLLEGKTVQKFDLYAKNDVEKIQAEIEHRKLVVRPQALADVKEARAQGDLSENFEYKAAKQFLNRNKSRIRYLEKVLENRIFFLPLQPAPASYLLQC